MNQSLVNHALAALIVSFSISIGFWIFLGVFNLIGFILWSLVAAALAVGISHKWKHHIIGTMVITAVIRFSIYWAMTSSILQ